MKRCDVVRGPSRGERLCIVVWLSGQRVQPGGSFDTIAGTLNNMFNFANRSVDASGRSSHPESYWMLDVNQELESSNPKGFFLPVDSSAKPTR
jgi:hypothetical protein